MILTTVHGSDEERERKFSTDDMWARFDGNDIDDIIVGYVGVSENHEGYGPRATTVPVPCGIIIISLLSITTLCMNARAKVTCDV
jgi:hypothetical protein